MPRFNANRWMPKKDSTPDLAVLDPKRVVLGVQIGPGGESGCPCGCTDMPKGAKAKFAMGHDARLRGKLIRAHLTGTEVTFIYSLPIPIADLECDTETLTAVEVADRYGWRRYLDQAVAKREEKNRLVLQRALGSKRLVQVGRWDYTGQVVAVYATADGGDFDIEYVTKTGDVRKTRVPADEAPLAPEEEN